MFRFILAGLSVHCLMASGGVANAAPVTYNFSGSFTDGQGDFSGSFVFDDATNLVTSGTVSVTAGRAADFVNIFPADNFSFVGQFNTSRIGFSASNPVAGNRGFRIIFNPNLASGAPVVTQIFDAACADAPCTLMTAYSNTFRQALTATLTRVPSVTGLSPASGVLGGGTIVTITGAGFTNDAGVTFGGTAASSVTYVSPTEITAVLPAGGAAGVVDVVVTTSGGTSPNTAADDFTYVAVAAPVPTMSEWAMILFGMILAGGAALSVRRRQPAI